jgi:hypothetical protein
MSKNYGSVKLGIYDAEKRSLFWTSDWHGAISKFLITSSLLLNTIDDQRYPITRIRIPTRNIIVIIINPVNGCGSTTSILDAIVRNTLIRPIPTRI